MAGNYPYTAGQGPRRAKARIGNVTAGFMVAVALLFDLLQFLLSFLTTLPGLGYAVLVIAWFLGIFAIIVFGLWFFFSGVNYFGGKKAAYKLISAFSMVVVELTPFVDALPAITAGVVLMLVASRIEDAAGHNQNENFANMSPVRRNAVTSGMIRGRPVSDRRADPTALKRTERGLGTLARQAGGLNIENRGGRAAERMKSINSMARGKDLMAEREEPKNKQETLKDAA